MQKLQKELKLSILNLHHKANSGHIGSSMSCIDILASIFFYNKTKKDTFILSKGHASTALYSCLNKIGEISDDELETFYKNNTTLPAHPAALKFKSIPFATGSLGHGLSIAAGIAKAKKIKNDNSFVFAVLSDGDTNEGTTWEACHFITSNK